MAIDNADRRATLLTEVLAYVGGVILLVGVSLLTARYWPDLDRTTKLILAGTATLALLAGGLSVPVRKPPGQRMRVVMWAVSTAAAAFFFGLLGHEFLDWPAVDIVTLTGIGSAAYAAVLWLWSRRLLIPQLVFLVTTLVAAGAVGAQIEGTYGHGLAVWIAALLWFLLGHSELVPHTRPTRVLAAAASIIGAGLMIPLDAGIAIGLVTVACLLVYAIKTRDLALVLVGALGTLQLLPIAVTEWFPGRLAAPIALLIAGAVLVGSAVALARHSSSRERRNPSAEPLIDASRYDAVVLDLDSGNTEGHRPPVSGVRIPDGTVRFIGRLGMAGLSSAAVSASTDCGAMLTAAGLADLIDVRVDGLVASDLALAGKPDPAILLVAAHRLGVSPSRTVVLTQTPAGVDAARAGGFGLVIGVEPHRHPTGLAVPGPDAIVGDLSHLTDTPDQQPAR